MSRRFPLCALVLVCASSATGQVPTKTLHGLNFSPFLAGQDPNQNPQIPRSQIEARMLTVAPHTNWVRSFGSINGLEQTPDVARQLGLRIAAGAWISRNLSANQTEINNLITAANAGKVDIAVVGNEVMLRNDVSESVLIGYMNQVRQAIPSGIPVTTAEVYKTLIDHPNVIAASDVVFGNFYPYWEGISIDNSICALAQQYLTLSAASLGKQVIVAETGWPSGGNAVGAAIPSPANAAKYFLQVVSWAKSNDIPYFYFAGFDEAWKIASEGPQGAHWGIWDQSAVVKPGMQEVLNGQTTTITCDGIVCGPGPAEISLSYIPPYGSFDQLEGRVCGVNPTTNRVAVYIKVGSGWWNKPTFAGPLTTILTDGAWSTDITTGGIDEEATNIAAFLIPLTYTPPQVSGAPTLPDELTANSLARVQVQRTQSSISGEVRDGANHPIKKVIIDGGALGSTSTAPSGRYSFANISVSGTVTLTPSDPNLVFSPPTAPVTISTGNQIVDFIATPKTPPPALSLDRTRLNYAARSATLFTPGQKVVVSFGGGSTPWTATTSQTWLQVTPASGVGATRLAVSINPALIPAAGTATATLTVSAPAATPTSATVTVYSTRLTTSVAPFGAFDTPTNNAANIAGSIAVTGWAMDDIYVSELKIYRDKIGNEAVQPNGLVYIGDAVFISNARSDIEGLYPALPFNYRGGWGYLMLTNDVYNGGGPRGNGTIKLWAIAKDIEGNTMTLGSKTITLNNANSKVPFGAMDQPGQGAIVAGILANSGWVLTPQPNIMEANPSKITLYIDGVSAGKLNYGQPRSDVAAIFPGYRNSAGPGASFALDTSLYSNGMHSIYWEAIDDVKNVDGIGSRFFFIENGLSASVLNPPVLSEDRERPRPQRGAVPQVRTAQELERVVIDLPEGEWTGSHVVDGEMRPLPAGSTLDNGRGAFYWHLGPGFLGKYELLFTSADGAVFEVTVNVEPRSYAGRR